MKNVVILYGGDSVESQISLQSAEGIIKNIDQTNKSDGEICPIYAGVSILDNCNQIQEFKVIKFFNMNYPLLIIPFLSRSSEIVNKQICLNLNDGKYILNSNKTILTNIEKSNDFENVNLLEVDSIEIGCSIYPNAFLI